MSVAWLGRGKMAPLPEASPFARDLLAGLAGPRKSAPCKYFYDETGSALFERICELPEYYLTRVETALLRAHAGEIAALAGPRAQLVEYGAGALAKAQILLDAMDAVSVYVPVDISGAFLRARAGELAVRRPRLAVRPLIADFTAPFALPPGRCIGFFPGSTIGNFERPQALAFLARAARRLSALLIGVDLVKDPAVLHAAYNDTAGLTAAFNRNLLARANRELGADFDPGAFAHYAPYDPARRRVEMHLVGLRAQTVHLCGHAIAFEEGDNIHTESSHKYTRDEFRALAREAGFDTAGCWSDSRSFFSIHWLVPRAPRD
ncbi:MAG TPA: L-histidine N(alpha)-methyltransferase [Rhizomicrobium sp.]|nr:L-histidine N(alpha)-methyltransferase [Rhizomicrobium sp.]